MTALAPRLQRPSVAAADAPNPPGPPGRQKPIHPALPAPQAEFSLSAADFEQVRTLIHRRAGISLNAGKQAMVTSRLARRLRDTGQRSFAGYLAWLQAHPGPDGQAEWQAFVNCLTTNLTSFFREDHHFQALVHDLQDLQGRHARSGRALRIWCCAASTGEEPYSVAMTAAETLGPQAAVQIIASDIDTDALATAQAGVYAVDARGLSAQRLQRHFLRGKGERQGLIRIKPERAMGVEFRPFNLMGDDWPATLGAPFDIIFCRNVMIYFDAATQRQVLVQMHRMLQPDGLLYVGHSENFTEHGDLLALRGKTIYQRV